VHSDIIARGEEMAFNNYLFDNYENNESSTDSESDPIELEKEGTEEAKLTNMILRY
jgi:hypothetical protein